MTKREFGDDWDSDNLKQLPVNAIGPGTAPVSTGELPTSFSPATTDNAPAGPVDFIHVKNDNSPPPPVAYIDKPIATNGDDSFTVGNLTGSYVYAGGGDDFIIAASGDDVFFGQGGDDYLLLDDGNNEAHGGDGADDIETGVGNDTLYGDAGDDYLYAATGSNILFGGAGNDTLRADYQAGAINCLSGESGYDVLEIEAPNGATIDGGTGKDAVVIWAEESPDITIDLVAQTVSNGSATDNMTSVEGAQGGTGNDTIIGNAADNWLAGGWGDDILEGGRGDDLLIGDENRGQWFVEPGLYTDYSSNTAVYSHASAGVTIDHNMSASRAFGGDGTDLLYFVDTFIGSAFNDVMVADPQSSNNTTFLGGDGNDLLVGALATGGAVPGLTYLDGGNGNDTVRGGTSDDTLIGGAGSDIMTGGTGADTFRFALPDLTSGAVDTINDFEFGLDHLDFSAVAGLKFIGSTAFSGSRPEIRYGIGGGRTVIQIDVDGNGVANSTIFMQGNHPLAETAPGSNILWQADLAAPTLVSMTPGSGSVIGHSFVKLTFSEAVRVGTGEIAVHTMNGTVLSTTYLANIRVYGDTAYVPLYQTLSPGDQFYVTMTQGVFTDLAHNAWSGIASSAAATFTVAQDLTPPSLLSFSPAQYQKGVALDANIVLHFDEDVHPAYGAFTLWIDFGNIREPIETIDVTDGNRVLIQGSTVTINPTENFFASYSYVLTDGALADDHGNVWGGFGEYGGPLFTTQAFAGTGPALVSLSPGNGAQNIDPGANIVLEFDRDVRAGIQGLASSRWDYFGFVRGDGVTSKTIFAGDAAQVTFSGHTVTINPDIDLEPGQTYSIIVGKYAVEDSYGRFFAGVPGVSDYQLTAKLLFKGTSGADILNGTAGDDTIDLTLGGSDVSAGGNGRDIFLMGAVLDAADQLDGGGGNDVVVLDGLYSGSLLLHSGMLTNIETLQLSAGHIYKLVIDDTVLTAKQHLTIDGSQLGAGDVLNLNAAYETDGVLQVIGGQGSDTMASGVAKFVFSGGIGDDILNATGEFNGSDSFDGGKGNDTLSLNGDYSAGITMATYTLIQVETIKLAAGHTYKLSLNDGIVDPGKTLAIDASKLSAGDQLQLDGSAELDGMLTITGGAGADTIVGGAGADEIVGGLGGDLLTGGGGADRFTYKARAESTGAGYDTLIGFDFTSDHINVRSGVDAIDATMTGELSLTSFDADLAALLTAKHLAKHHAVLANASSGDLAGQTFLIVDLNGKAGYQSGGDLVLHLQDPANLAGLDTTDFV